MVLDVLTQRKKREKKRGIKITGNMKKGKKKTKKNLKKIKKKSRIYGRKEKEKLKGLREIYHEV